jgi:hypothetical protein
VSKKAVRHTGNTNRKHKKDTFACFSISERSGAEGTEICAGAKLLSS